MELERRFDMKEQLLHLLAEYEESIYRDFARIVNLNSFSSYPAGIERVHDALQEIAAAVDVSIESIYSSQKARPHLVYGKELEQDFYAVIGHYDTVHPPESDFQELYADGPLLRGPGSNDMKSGLIVAIYSLAILQRLFPGRTIPVKAFFNSDEEIGSPDSKALIQTLFVGAKAGFVFEPGRIEQNSLVTARKGIFGLSVEITGKPSHAGSSPEKGVNAIVEAARIVLALEALNDYTEGITVGCNVIEGGVAANVVAPFCRISVDVRYQFPAQEQRLREEIESIFLAPTDNGASVSYTILHDRPPLVKTEASQKLYQQYKRISESLGLACGEVSSGGGSDANFLSAMGIPVIDGVGAVGNHSHTKEEYTLKSSIPDRIKIFCLLMIELMQNSEEHSPSH